MLSSSTQHLKEDPIVQQVGCQALHFSRELGTEQKRLSFSCVWHVLFFHNAPNMGFKAHVEHPVSILEYEVSDLAQREVSPFNQIHQTSWSGNENLSITPFQFAQLLINGFATSCYCSPQGAIVRELKEVNERKKGLYDNRLSIKGWESIALR